jgi:hypothetical protein
MKNEKKYLKPEAVIVEFNTEDIILTSDIDGIIDEGDTPNLPISGQ